MDGIDEQPTHDGILVDLTPREARNQAVPAVFFAAVAGLLVWVPATMVVDVGTGGAQAVLGVLVGVGLLSLGVVIRDLLVHPRLQTVELGARRLAIHTVNRLADDRWACALDELTSVDLLGEVLLLRRPGGTKYLQLHGQTTTNRLALRDLLRHEMTRADGAPADIPEPLLALTRPLSSNER